MPSLKTPPSKISTKLAQLRDSGQTEVLTRQEIGDALNGVQIPEKADAVFEGGGVKGIALCGALDVAEHLGVKWQKVAGTSAGAITACLLAAGYTSSELIHILTKEMDFNKFMDEDLLDRVPLLGKLASALFEKGIYEGDYFEDWIGEKLAAKGVKNFGDVKDENGENRLKLIASDVTRSELLILPDDLQDYGRKPDLFPVARAARMSMSIPYFFEPVEMNYKGPKGGRRKSFIVDGGMLSNFPVWLFDKQDPGAPRWPTYGFKLVEPNSEQPASTKLPHNYVLALVNTMMEAHDNAYIDRANFKRTIGIPTMGIRTTQFDINDDDKKLLLRSGQEAAISFFKNWNFDNHNNEFRGA